MSLEQEREFRGPKIPNVGQTKEEKREKEKVRKAA